MHNTQYIYGIDAAELENKFYFDALRHKLDAGRKLYRELYDKKADITEDDQKRMFYVAKALEHTENLISELDQ